MEIKHVREPLDEHNIYLAKGYEAISILGSCNLNRNNIETLAKQGCRYISTRSIGYNNVDLDALEDFNIRFSNSPYSEDSVSDYTVMLTLMALRKMKITMKKMFDQDFRLKGIQGKEVHNLIFGVIGTGRIGSSTARKMHALGGTVIAFDPYPKEELHSVLSYVELDVLLRKSDVIILHSPLIESTYHLINERTLSKTKKGVVIINAARGELMDTKSLIKYLDMGHVSSCALDVLEGEEKLFHQDLRNVDITSPEFIYLQNHPDVILTPHSAFYTDQAVSDMVNVSLKSLYDFMNVGDSQNRIK